MWVSINRADEFKLLSIEIDRGNSATRSIICFKGNDVHQMVDTRFDVQVNTDSKYGAPTLHCFNLFVVLYDTGYT